MTVPELATERLLLRQFRPDDLAALIPILCDPVVTRYVASGEPVRKEEVAGHLKRLSEKYWSEYGLGRWALIYRETGELIGYCGFRMNGEEPELHYLLARAFWCAGLATEAVRACLRYAFAELHQSRVIALVRPENTASVRVLKKTGMKQAGSRGCFFGHDFQYYAITAADFESAQSGYLTRSARLSL
jgi:ribosomal-protein-alanine N-acetyltransferase